MDEAASESEAERMGSFVDWMDQDEMEMDRVGPEVEMIGAPC